MRRHKRPFCGELSEPLSTTFQGPKANKSRAVLIYLLLAYNRQHKAKIDRRVSLLLQRYTIDEGDSERWKKLALALAREFVPGFRIERPHGAKRKWGADELKALQAKVEEIAADGACAMEACRRIASAPSPDNAFPQHISPQSLYRRYQEAKHQTPK